MTQDTILTYTCGKSTITFARDSPLWVTEITGASNLDVAISETQGAGQIGSTVSYQSIQPRDITINGAVMSAVEINRAGLLACVLPGVIGRLTVHQGSGAWYLDGYPKSTPALSDGSVVQDFQFVLHCPYPYWRSVEDSSTQIAALTPMFSFPCTLAGTWYLSKYTESLFATVTNSGSVPLDFDVVLTAMSPVKNPEVYHVERGTSIKINRTMQAGETITLSTVYGRKGVALTLADGTTSNGFKYLDVSSDLNMQLAPGDNTIRYAADNNREGLRVTINAPKGAIPGV